MPRGEPREPRQATITEGDIRNFYNSEEAARNILGMTEKIAKTQLPPEVMLVMLLVLLVLMLVMLMVLVLVMLLVLMLLVLMLLMMLLMLLLLLLTPAGQVILMMMHVVVFSGDGVVLERGEVASTAQVYYLSLIHRCTIHSKYSCMQKDFVSGTIRS